VWANQDESSRTRIALVKVIYLLSVTVLVFTIPAFSATRPFAWYIISLLLAVQAVGLFLARVPASRILGPVWRVKWLFLFLLAVYTLLPTDDSHLDAAVLIPLRIPAIGWTVAANISGLFQALLMCCQIMAVLLASSLVRLTGQSTDLVHGLQVLRLPRLFVYSLDHTFDLLAGSPNASRTAGRGRRGDRNGSGGGGRAKRTGAGVLATLRQLMKGDFSVFARAIQHNLDLAAQKAAPQDREQGPASTLARDVAAVTGVAIAMSSIKILKFLPGIPFASGHKTVLLFPLYVLASQLTTSRWGATAAGSIMGVIAFLQGDGRFGLLELPKHIAPGIVIDLLRPAVQRLPAWTLGYCFLGLLAGAARSATEFLVIFALGARAEVYLFPVVRLIPNLIAGFLSGFVTILITRTFAPAVVNTSAVADRRQSAADPLSNQRPVVPPSGGQSSSNPP
jgi:hypothetical protein